MTEEQKKDSLEIEIQELKGQLEETKSKCEDYLNGWKRERADFINYKKEEMERISGLVQYANEELILKILPILDSIHLAESHIPEELKTNKWMDGFSQIKNQLCDFLLKEGIEEIKTLGEKFNPNLMESIEEVESDKEPGTVVEQSQRGYKMHDRVVRAAKVKIAK